MEALRSTTIIITESLINKHNEEKNVSSSEIE